MTKINIFAILNHRIMCVTHRCTFGQNIPYDKPYPIFKGPQKDNP